MIKNFFTGLLLLIVICFTSSTTYVGLNNSNGATSNFSQYVQYDMIKEKMDEIYGEDNINCVIEATYFEARGENTLGHRAIIEVIFNRYQSSLYPDTFCEVVKQNKQFSYRNGKTTDDLIYKDKKTKEKITNTVYNHLFTLTYNEEYRLLDECVVNYDGKAFKKPKWASRMDMVAEIGNHQFYCHKS